MQPFECRRRRNPIAKAVRTPSLRPRVVAPKKGKGSYSRKKENYC